MHVAFYAPMKPPDHPVPSGDRTMARALLSALAPDVTADVASGFVSRDSRGDPGFQAGKLAEAQDEITRLLPLGRAAGWQAWITYHNYYKAPDLIGPHVARALGIPFFLVEATRARKRLSGPWASYARAAEAATDAAAAVFYLTHRDGEALKAYRTGPQILVHLPPFLAREDLPPATGAKDGMLSVGMFRTGDKLASYGLIAQSLGLLGEVDWHLTIAGDGPARAEVARLMAPFGDRVTLAGALDPDALQKAYQGARILFWPGVNEAFGMTYLEAQAAGLCVVAQNRPGVRDVLAPGAAYPAPESGAAGLAARVALLLSHPKLSAQLGATARAHVAAKHLLGPARATLRQTLEDVIA